MPGTRLVRKKELGNKKLYPACSTPEETTTINSLG